MGDIEYITSRDGRIKNVYTYDAFGSITNAEELIRNRYTYNGDQYDQAAQQYYLRARSDNPLVGRFTQEDVYLGDQLKVTRQDSTRSDFPEYPHIDSPEGKGKVEIKYENGGALSYGLGNSEEGLKTFNDNIQSISVYNETTDIWEVIYKK